MKSFHFWNNLWDFPILISDIKSDANITPNLSILHRGIFQVQNLAQYDNAGGSGLTHCCLVFHCNSVIINCCLYMLLKSKCSHFK